MSGCANWKSGLLLGVAVLVLSLTNASAQDQSTRCDVPPYGDTEEAYRAYVEKTQFLVIKIGEAFLPTKILPRFCRAKFKGEDRSSYYNLGITDHDFQTLSTTKLAMQWILAVKRLANRAAAAEQSSTAPPPETDDGSKVYALAYCTKDGYCQVHGHAHMVGNGVFEEVPYRTLSECRQQYANTEITADPDGRTVFPDGSWYECRSKHVDTWEPAQ